MAVSVMCGGRLTESATLGYFSVACAKQKLRSDLSIGCGPEPVEVTLGGFSGFGEV